MAMGDAWRDASLDPATVGLIEAHGTGTPTGDEVELRALARHFGATTGERAVVGSVKSMIGHAMPAAGAAGLIKTALAIHHGVLPPSLHCEDPHPAVSETRFRVVQEAEPWEGSVRRAGVNAFGFGGINGHVVLDAHGRNGRRPTPAEPRRVEEEILVLAADSQQGLLDALDRGQTAGGGGWRLAVVDPTPERLETARGAVESGHERRGRDGIFFTPSGLIEQGGLVAFLFPGVEAIFEPRIDGVAEEFGLPPAHVTTDNLEGHGGAAIAIGILLHSALGELGIRPDVIAGHSIGEWTGMVTSGMLGAEDVETFVSELVPGSLEVPGVVFAALGCGAEKAREALDGLDEVAISHDNCPHQSILCGPEDQIATACERLGQRRVLWEVLPFRSGFHSPLFTAFVEPHARAFARIPVSQPAVPLWSSTTRSPYPTDEQEVRDLFSRHLVEPVRFRELLLALYDHGVRVFVQVGTGSLHAFVGDTLRGLPHLAIAANAAQRTGLEQLRRVAAALYVEGADVRLERAGVSTRRKPAPMRLQLGVPFVHLDSPLAGAGPSLVASPVVEGLGASPVVEEFDAAIRELLGAQQDVVRALAEAPATAGSPAARAPAPPAGSEPDRLVEEHVLSVETYPELLDHCFFHQPDGWPNLADRRPVVPLTMAISLLVDLAQRFAPDRVPVAIEDFLAARWLDVEPPVTVTMTAKAVAPDRVRVAIEGYMQAVVRLADRYPEAPGLDPAPLTDEKPSAIPAEEVYTDRWMFHGPRYQGIVELYGLGKDGIRGWILASMEVDRLAMPVRVKRIEFFRPEPAPGASVDCTVRVREVAPREVRSDIEVASGGRLYVRITGWEDWRFETNEGFLAMRHPQTNLLSDEHPEGFMLVADRNWSAATRDWLARRYLSAEERAELDTQPLRGRSEWLTGRIAAKDAVRRLLIDQGQGVFPIEVSVRSDPSGRPVVSGMFAQDLRVSIAHKNRTAVAVAAIGRDPGIDLEPVEPRGEGFVQLAFSEAELALLPPGDRDEWLTRLWCAKEAVGKSRGTGLDGDPRALALEKVDGERLLVDGCWTETCYREGFIIAWTSS
jgi:malonyl CoA-acyl carrier protein transacylase/phosphopantetheinyl transferase